MNPLQLLREATKEFPLLKYAWGVIGIVAVIAIIGGLHLSSINVPIISILTVLGVMVLIFVFSIIATKNSDPLIRIPFLVLVYTIVLSVCASVIILGVFVFTGHPSNLNNFFNLTNQTNSNNSSIPNYQTSKVNSHDTQQTEINPFLNYPSIFPKDKPNLTIYDSKNYLTRFNKSKTNELELSDLGKEAFEQGDYEWSKNFFKQCKLVQSSKVWMSNYPYFAGDYFLTNQKDSAIIILNEMYNQVGIPFTYLSHAPPISMLLNALNDTKQKVQPQYQSIIDKYVDMVTNKQ